MPSPEFDRGAAREHLRALAAEHGVEVSWVSSWGLAEAWVEGKVVAIPRIRTGRDYLVGLHELGHCISPEAVRLHDQFATLTALACEGWAWAWAAANADPEIARGLDARQWRLVASSFGSYVMMGATGAWEAATSDLAEEGYLQLEAGESGPPTS